MTSGFTTMTEFVEFGRNSRDALPGGRGPTSASRIARVASLVSHRIEIKTLPSLMVAPGYPPAASQPLQAGIAVQATRTQVGLLCSLHLSSLTPAASSKVQASIRRCPSGQPFRAHWP